MDFNLNSFSQDEKFLSLREDSLYDVLILGGGPAGMTAAIYAMRKGLNTGIIMQKPGGQVAETALIENYPGFNQIDGVDLVSKFREHVAQFSLSFGENLQVTEIIDGKEKNVLLSDGSMLKAKSIIIATGKEARKLNVPGEKELSGRGVAYCATCDAPFFSGKKVVVAGGGNSGIEAAIDLARVANEVYIIQFIDKLTADKILTDKLATFNNCKIFFDSEITSINGKQKVESVTIRNNKENSEKNYLADGVFVEIGLTPNSSFAHNAVNTNKNGEIMINCNCETNIPGIFAAGDVTSVRYKQLVIAAGEGAKAALAAADYLLNI